MTFQPFLDFLNDTDTQGKADRIRQFPARDDGMSDRNGSDNREVPRFGSSDQLRQIAKGFVPNSVPLCTWLMQPLLG
jgi:hypothetical protein